MLAGLKSVSAVLGHSRGERDISIDFLSAPSPSALLRGDEY